MPIRTQPFWEGTPGWRTPPFEAPPVIGSGGREAPPRPAEQVMHSFAEALKGLLRETTARQEEAAEQTRRLLTGEPVELHEVLLAVEKAHLAFQTLLAVRNRLLEAYQELTRMPL